MLFCCKKKPKMGPSPLPRMKAMIKKVTPRKTATPVMRWMKWAISLAKHKQPMT